MKWKKNSKIIIIFDFIVWIGVLNYAFFYILGHGMNEIGKGILKYN